MGDMMSAFMPKRTGDAQRESGENITWRDVDYDKLRSSRLSNPNIEAFMSNQPTPQSTPLPSSQRSVSPISQARDFAKEDNTTEYMGRPLSDDDDSPNVGQIL